MALYTRDEISNCTGFDAGVPFTSEEDVKDYFQAERMLDMFGDFAEMTATDVHGDDVRLADALDTMAAIVIENEWHCTFAQREQTTMTTTTTTLRGYDFNIIDRGDEKSDETRFMLTYQPQPIEDFPSEEQGEFETYREAEMTAERLAKQWQLDDGSI